MEKEVLELAARNKFSCLGSDCPRTCCHQWDVDVDEGTLHKWEDIQDTEERRILLNSVGRNNSGKTIMTMDSRGYCVELNEDGLCGIQSKYGHEYIPEICRTYPRHERVNYYREYITASLSCPVITENALFSSEDAPLFTRSAKQYEQGSLVQDEAVSTDFQRLLYRLDDYMTEILEKYEYSNGILLFFLSGIFKKIIDTPTDVLTNQYIHDLRSNTASYLTNISLAVADGKIKPDVVTAGSYWKTIHKISLLYGIDERYLPDSASKFNRVAEEFDGTDTACTAVYESVCNLKNQAEKHVAKRYESVFKKYIRLMFINKGFPLAPGDPHQYVLVGSLLDLSLLQLLIWAEIERNGKLTAEYLAECVVEVDRKSAHSSRTVKNLMQQPRMMQIEQYNQCFLDIF